MQIHHGFDVPFDAPFVPGDVVGSESANAARIGRVQCAQGVFGTLPRSRRKLSRQTPRLLRRSAAMLIS